MNEPGKIRAVKGPTVNYGASLIYQVTLEHGVVLTNPGAFGSYADDSDTEQVVASSPALVRDLQKRAG